MTTLNSLTAPSRSRGERSNLQELDSIDNPKLYTEDDVVEAFSSAPIPAARSSVNPTFFFLPPAFVLGMKQMIG